ncbi:hypothetical protein HYV81_02435 [Candidatus Woesearchaeota archaeon]|nr:hypothetical protein [Candidatus Woesearchaeota archaeon]
MVKAVTKRNGGWRAFSTILSMLEESVVRISRKYTEKIVKRYIISLMIMIAALALIMYGVVQVLNTFFPGIQSGILYIVLGLTIAFAAYLYMKGE